MFLTKRVHKNSFHFIDVTEAQGVLLEIFLVVVVHVTAPTAFKVVVKTLVDHWSHQQTLDQEGPHFVKNLLSADERRLGIYHLYPKAKRINLSSSVKNNKNNTPRWRPEEKISPHSHLRVLRLENWKAFSWGCLRHTNPRPLLVYLKSWLEVSKKISSLFKSLGLPLKKVLVSSTRF